MIMGMRVIPAEIREGARMLWEEGKKETEISRILGVSVSTCRHWSCTQILSTEADFAKVLAGYEKIDPQPRMAKIEAWVKKTFKDKLEYTPRGIPVASDEIAAACAKWINDYNRTNPERIREMDRLNEELGELNPHN
jgi:uncharacterized protein YjcR